MAHRHPERVENYTTAVLVMVFVNLLWIFTATWIYAGLAAPVAISVLLYLGITRLERYVQSHG